MRSLRGPFGILGEVGFWRGLNRASVHAGRLDQASATFRSLQVALEPSGGASRDNASCHEAVVMAGSFGLPMEDSRRGGRGPQIFCTIVIAKVGQRGNCGIFAA